MRWGHNSKCLGMSLICGDIRFSRFGSRVGDLEIFRKIRPCSPDISPNMHDPETHLNCDPTSFLMIYLNLVSKIFFEEPVGEISEKLISTLSASHYLVLQNFFLMTDSDRA